MKNHYTKEKILTRLGFSTGSVFVVYSALKIFLDHNHAFFVLLAIGGLLLLLGGYYASKSKDN